MTLGVLQIIYAETISVLGEVTSSQDSKMEKKKYGYFLKC